MRFIDSLLNKITMYRLMLWYLEVLYFGAVMLCFLRLLPYNPFDFLFSGLFALIACWAANQVFARLFRVTPNVESQYITGFILALIIGPLPFSLSNVGFLGLAALLAMGSKYLIVLNKQHIFNPAAFAVTITAILINKGASWWVGDPIMLPFIIIGALLVLHKTDRFTMVASFLASSTFFLLIFGIVKPQDTLAYLINPATLFFACVMLTEPSTSPAKKTLRIYYGAVTGFVMVILQQVLTISYTMELALLLANIVGRIIHFSTKHQLTLIDKKEVAPGIWQFVFTHNKPVNFIPGQFLEWTLHHPHPDSRGNRRYFTIASSPTEEQIMLTAKVPEKPSSFKQALVNLKAGANLYATNLEGEFVLQKDPKTKYVFIAGGIGITPFRSIIKYMLDKDLSLPITLFYIAHDEQELVFDELFKKAENKFGLQLVRVVSENPPPNWQGEVGRLTQDMIKKHVPDYASRVFYISGPQPMIVSYRDLLQKMRAKHIKTDFFPGY